MKPLLNTFLVVVMLLVGQGVGFADVPKGCSASYWHKAEYCTDKANGQNKDQKTDRFHEFFGACMDSK